MKKEMIAMILAGGRGSRLGVLTTRVAKPAVPFGSRYHIIDFPLSNCTNSGIDTVGVLTQYQPLALNTYVSNGHPWDLDRNNGGLFILPPYQHNEGSAWYKNTANAIYQNIAFVENFLPDYVLILSGDHIYKMDYSIMLQEHVNSHADVTIAVYAVPWEEAPRFGIMNTDENGQIIEFDEKPAEPKSNLASMGIYIFNWSVLKAALIADEKLAASQHDFGKNIIPQLLAGKKKLMSYVFSGYWKDVGTISSLWESNMDLLDQPEQLNFRDPGWRIYSRNPIRPAHYISASGSVKNSALTDGCVIKGVVIHSVLSHSVKVDEGAVVKDSVLLPGAHIRAGAQIEKAIIGIDTKIGENVRIGGKDGKGHTFYDSKICANNISVIDGGLTIRNGAQIPSGCMVAHREGKDDSDIIERYGQQSTL